MKYILDAQISFKIAISLKKRGFDVLHTNDLPNKDYTTDEEIRKLSLKENRIVITKDSDFLDSYLLKQRPKKLLLITTGNINNSQLIELFEIYFNNLDVFFGANNYIELNQNGLIIHE